MTTLNQDEACNVLSAWTALEVLSPQSIKDPKALIPRQPKSPEEIPKQKPLLFFHEDGLPWENGGEAPPQKGRWHYKVVIGTIALKKALPLLFSQYTTDPMYREELQPVSGEAIMAEIIVDNCGYLANGNKSIAISSFAWGLPQALQGHIKQLAHWPTVEQNTISTLYEMLYRQNEEGEDIPLDKAIIDATYERLIHLFEIPQQLLEENRCFSVRFQYKPQASLLNSFYLQDLAEAKEKITKNIAPPNLLKYLKMEKPPKRQNILTDEGVLEKILSPNNIPAGRWPGPGRHPLVLLQQAAVNICHKELNNDNGIIAINGPPGTGKTTLLRDIVANLMVQRAEAMCAFDNPNTAFSKANHTVKNGSYTLDFYTLDNRLKGFEMVIASSNNKAVENVSAELPSLQAIAEDADELRYFNALSDRLIDAPSWGLISAVLGNRKNRSAFSEHFWWNKKEDCTLSTYLKHARNPHRNLDTKKVPPIIQHSDLPKNPQDALKRWKAAKKHFQDLLTSSKNRLNQLQRIRDNIQHLEKFKKTLPPTKTIATITEEHLASPPNIFQRFFKTPFARKWKKTLEQLRRYNHMEKRINRITKKLGAQILNEDFFEENHSTIHTTSPWCSAKTHGLRDDVFIAAIKLHKAFIDAAATPIHKNLMTFMHYFKKTSNSMEPATWKLMPELWHSFFLIVPSISTTFASLSTMFNTVPHNTLGYLLIDEAGQALPQAAVGGIMKTKRAVVTGDPLQIEPVVTLTRDLTRKICEHFKVNPNDFNGPEASVQTLCDAATPYFYEFHTQYGSRSVGVPLLVHRRCADPMFTISNTIAYEGLMVQAKKDNTSAIRNCLGPSSWFHVEGYGEDKWCPEEGEKLLEILTQLAFAKVFPDFYIISPFRIVAENLRDLLISSSVLNTWIGKEKAYSWTRQNVGTVHTVQGREAEAIFIVLGAPMEEQRGARHWAGSTPNLLNVAITRAKEATYILGNEKLWRNAGTFGELHRAMPIVVTEPSLIY